MKMKRTGLIILLAFIAAVITSCVKQGQPAPQGTGTPTKTDTSTTVISNTELVGNWNIVSDTISYMANTAMYYGTPNDHFDFTAYGNLYIKNGFESQVDTAIYSVSTSNNKVQWTNNYTSVQGQSTRQPLAVGAYTITSLAAHSLVLTQNLSTPQGVRFEVITFQK
jgi:hypothetical protein